MTTASSVNSLTSCGHHVTCFESICLLRRNSELIWLCAKVSDLNNYYTDSDGAVFCIFFAA